jgi:Cu(I)/Ag(I) efflux system protein CusF
MKTLKTLVLATLLATSALTATHLLAQTTPASASEMADGEVRKIDKDARKITLKHGPIKNLDMPGMTMVFQVKDTAVLDTLDKLAVGEKVRFSAEQQQGAIVVTVLEKAGAK